MSSVLLPDLMLFMESIQVPYRLLGSLESGRLLVIEEGARILAMAPPGSDRNVLWSHPSLGQCTARKELSNLGSGGMGGIRLWQSPEAAYHWTGLAEPKTFSNYQIQEAMDPGAYTLRELSENRCVLEGSAVLTDYRTGTHVAFDLHRVIEVARLPDDYARYGGVGFQLHLENHLFLREGNETSRVDLWHLMQLPTPSTVGAQVKPETRPGIYFNPESCDGWEVREQCFIWRTNGKRRGKLGLGIESVLGGPFAIRDYGATVGIHLWTIPLPRDQEYVDAPPGRVARDQVIQFWDGFDFCEVEYHSPGASLLQPEIMDVSEMTYLEIPTEKFKALQSFAALPSI